MASRVQYYTIARNVIEGTRPVWTLYRVVREISEDMLLRPDSHSYDRDLLVERALTHGWHPLRDVDMMNKETNA
jgi:hypothetical protein